MGKALQYQTADLKKAVKVVKMEHCEQENCKMHHHVPKSTIADRDSGRFNMNSKPEGNQLCLRLLMIKL